MSDAFDFTPRQIAIAIAPKCTAALSIFGSSWIIAEVGRDQHKRAMSYHRIMMSMSVVDIIASSSLFMTTWPVPTGTPGAFGAVGTTQTCTAQGFFQQLGIMTIFFNGTLALYYYLTICCGFREERLRKSLLPKYILTVSFGLGTAFAGIGLDLYNVVGNVWCWITPYPRGCVESYEGLGESTCSRGDNASIFRWAFWHGPLWIVIIFVTFTMIKVHHFVLERERAANRYRYEAYESSCHSSHHPDGNTSHSSHGMSTAAKSASMSRTVANQGICYVLVFYVIWILPTVRTLMLFANYTPHFFVMFFLAFLLPVQGFLNFLVYIRPRFLKYRRVHPDWSFLRILRKVLGRGCGLTTSCMFLIHYADEHETDDARLGTIYQSNTGAQTIEGNEETAIDAAVEGEAEQRP